MAAVFYSRLIYLFLLISNYFIVQGHEHRQRRQMPSGGNQNIPGFQSRLDPFMQMNNNNPPFVSQNRNAQFGPQIDQSQFLMPNNNVPYDQLQVRPQAQPQPQSQSQSQARAQAQPQVQMPIAAPAQTARNPNVPFMAPNNNPVPFVQQNNNMPPIQPMSNNNNNRAQVLSSNNPTLIASNQPMNHGPMMENEHLLAASQSQMNPARSQGFYNSPAFQQNPFGEQKSAGWFGTNHVNWLSHQESELDKNKLAAAKYPPLLQQNSPVGVQPSMNAPPPKRDDGGPTLLAKVAKQYAAKGEKSFSIGPHETLQGRGPACTNFENFDGFVFGRFPCPLPASTGMNQLDLFCCGPNNYQYCCNQQEFSMTQRGAYGNHFYTPDQTFPKRSAYPMSTKKILAITLPIASVVVFGGIGVLVFIFHKKFRQEQYRVRKPTGAIRLQENYSILTQDALADRSIYEPDENPHLNSQA